MPVDAVDAGVDITLICWFDSLPRAHRLRQLALLRSIESGFGLANGRPGLSFSDALPDERRTWLERVARGALANDYHALRETAVRAWVSSEPVRAHLPLRTQETP